MEKRKLNILRFMGILLFGVSYISMWYSCENRNSVIIETAHNLEFDKLAPVWDEGIPLGNGFLGQLVWQKDDKLRFSLDRVDLWDLRPMENMGKQPEYSFKWIQEQVKKNTYKIVQQLFDKTYDETPAPTKLPGAAIEFDIQKLGAVKKIKLNLSDALCTVEWENGTALQTFVNAEKQAGWFRFSQVADDFIPQLIPPDYEGKSQDNDIGVVQGQSLKSLGYTQGRVSAMPGKTVYRQKGRGGFEYEVALRWQYENNVLTGVWSISSTISEQAGQQKAETLVTGLLENTDFESDLQQHKSWWKAFRSRSGITLPDKVLEKQWYLELYKFGSVARKDAPPISLQAVWTADNGKLPPWKGDFHHDLNTQLSYWPAYSANHLDLEEGFTNWLWKYRDTFRNYAKTFFDSPGINVPGVTTLTGEPMGGWTQYSFSPTVAGWLAQHFYLHWRYSMDRDFLANKAYPWLKEVAVFFDHIAVKDDQGIRKLPLSSSPEINDNSIHAWFSETTNYDLAFIRWTYEKAAELALELGKKDEAQKWKVILSKWPDFALDSSGGLAIAPGYPFDKSHRHFSHLMGWHPLGLIDWSKGTSDQQIIRETLLNLEKTGSSLWVGYSFSWLGNLYARAKDGEKAAEVLRIFSENFCLPNSFHVNGEQHNRGYSNFKYRPFTLEGNFAFAAGVQEMLMQSHTGHIEIFPAIPSTWKDVEFFSLRAEGAFLVSARKSEGKTGVVEIVSEKGGICKLKNPFESGSFKIKTSWGEDLHPEGDIFSIEFPENGKVRLWRK